MVKIGLQGRAWGLGLRVLGPILLLALSCGSAFSHKGVPPKLFTQASDVGSSQRHEKVDIDFLIDGSKSIHGFLGEGKEEQIKGANYFTEILSKSDYFLRSGWSDVEIKYWRFGLQRAPRHISSIRDFATHKESFDEEETFINKAIQCDPCELNPERDDRVRLKVILTDLYQEGNDVGQLATLLNKYLVDPKLGIGILGVRNVFAGNVDDLPGNGKIPKKGVDTMPFYLLFIGPVPDVKHAIAIFQEKLNLAQDSDHTETSFHIVFARHTVSAAPTLAAIADRDSHPLTENTMIQGARELEIPQYGVYRNHPLKFNLCMFVNERDFQNSGGSMLTVAPVRKIVRSWIESQDKKEWYWSQLSGESPSAQAFAIAEVDKTSRNTRPCPAVSGGHSLATKALSIDTGRLQPDGVYLLQIDLPLQKSDFSQLDDWNLDAGEARKVVRDQAFAAAKDGSRPGKTPDLKFFLQTIADKLFPSDSESDIFWAHYYLYLRVE